MVTDEESANVRGSRLIGRVLPPAVRFWLKSQVESIDQLDIDLTGRDRQLLSGYIPAVEVIATAVSYQGLHLEDVRLSASDIRINIGQVIRGKALRLLKPFPVDGVLSLTASNVKASEDSSLLGSGLSSLWALLLTEDAFKAKVSEEFGAIALHNPSLSTAAVRLGDGRIGYQFVPEINGQPAEKPLILGAKVVLESQCYVAMRSPRWLSDLSHLDQSDKGESIPSLDGFSIDLGKDTKLSELTITPMQLHCIGQVIVQP